MTVIPHVNVKSCLNTFLQQFIEILEHTGNYWNTLSYSIFVLLKFAWHFGGMPRKCHHFLSEKYRVDNKFNLSILFCHQPNNLGMTKGKAGFNIFCWHQWQKAILACTPIVNTHWNSPLYPAHVTQLIHANVTNHANWKLARNSYFLKMIFFLFMNL